MMTATRRMVTATRRMVTATRRMLTATRRMVTATRRMVTATLLGTRDLEANVARDDASDTLAHILPRHHHRPRHEHLVSIHLML
jgi:hypothetical protein